MFGSSHRTPLFGKEIETVKTCQSFAWKHLPLVLGCGISFAASATSFAAARCLIAPDEGAIFVRSADGKRSTETWSSFTIVNVHDTELKKKDRSYVLAHTQDGRSGYVARMVIWNEAACQPLEQPEPTPVDPISSQPGSNTGGTAPLPANGRSGTVPSCDDAGSCQRGDIASDAIANRKTCGYSEARQKVYFQVDKRVDSAGRPFILSAYSKDVYFLNAGMPDANKFNIEHTFPQSKLKVYPGFEQTRADMYHLFAVESKINGVRGNMPFCEVGAQNSADQDRESKLGNSCFEPPEDQKGPVSRAMMYMAVAYNLSIENAEEKVLRKWNAEFPVSEFEANRAKRIEELQGNINPFVIQPSLAEQISDF